MSSIRMKESDKNGEEKAQKAWKYVEKDGSKCSSNYIAYITVQGLVV